MGHEDIRTTFNVYGHLFPDREEELVAALDRRQRGTQNRQLDSLLTLPAREGRLKVVERP
jgi:hypothetical protein